MKAIYATSFAVLATIAVSVCPKHPTLGVWVPQQDQVFVDALEALGLRQFDEIEHLNQGLSVNNIRVGKPYTVPYTSSLSASATWTTSSCTPVLHLSDHFGTTMTTLVESKMTSSATPTFAAISETLSQILKVSKEPPTPYSSHDKPEEHTCITAPGSFTSTPTRTPGTTPATTSTAHSFSHIDTTSPTTLITFVTSALRSGEERCTCSS
jgi:hypothetical protein